MEQSNTIQNSAKLIKSGRRFGIAGLVISLLTLFLILFLGIAIKSEIQSKNKMTNSTVDNVQTENAMDEGAKEDVGIGAGSEIIWGGIMLVVLLVIVVVLCSTITIGLIFSSVGNSKLKKAGIRDTLVSTGLVIGLINIIAVFLFVVVLFN